MTTVCPACFGPMFRRTCLGSHATTRSRNSGARESGPPIPRTGARFDHVLTWRPEYTSAKGAPLSSAIWRAYRLAGPHEVRIWAAAGERWPSPW
jgi:hypothetical protein